MPLPPFDTSGLLPPGRHPATPAELEAALVDAFPHSATRRRIFEWWSQLRLAMEHVLPAERQWVDGSFVTDKEDPRDLDLVSFFDGVAHDALPLHLRLLLKTLTDAKGTQAFWNCDSYAVFSYPAGHPERAASEAACKYWEKWFGHTRTGNAKGVVEVT